MPSYVAHYTSRLRVKYRAFGFVHTNTFRGINGSEQNGAEPLSVAATNLYEVLAPLLPSDFQVMGWDFANEGSEIYLPYEGELPEITGLSNIGQMSPANKALAISFMGRSVHGGRAMIEIFGFNFAVGPGIAQDFRVSTTESPTILDAVTTLNSVPAVLGANDGGWVRWYPYVNVKFNDHWVGQLRHG